jgi:hypothetical protein
LHYRISTVVLNGRLAKESPAKQAHPLLLDLERLKALIPVSQPHRLNGDFNHHGFVGLERHALEAVRLFRGFRW